MNNTTNTTNTAVAATSATSAIVARLTKFTATKFGETKALWLRELLASSRLARTPWLVALVGVAMGALLLLVGATSSSDAPSADTGRRLFHLYWALTTLFVTLFGPAIAANTIALEREGRTWEALVMAGVDGRTIDRGKFLAAYTHLIVYLLALLPSAGIAHLFGGVTYTETLLATIMVLGVAAIAVRFGLLLSALVPSTRTALLVTICASAVLCFFVILLGAGAASYLRHEVGMRALDSSECVVFWPVALLHEPLGFNWVRYLLIIPIGGALVMWFTLRELSVHALSTSTIPKPHRLATYLLIITSLAALLGLVPNKQSEIVFLEIVFALLSFGAIVVVNGDRPTVHASAARSLLLIGGGSVGVFVLLLVAKIMQSMGVSQSPPILLNYERSAWGALDPLDTVLFYAPAFTVFASGLAALVRTLVRRAAIAHAITLFVTFGVTIVPLLGAIVLKATNSQSVESVLAMSPLGALFVREPIHQAALVVAALFWILLGGLFLAITHHREQRTRR